MIIQRAKCSYISRHFLVHIFCLSSLSPLSPRDFKSLPTKRPAHPTFPSSSLASSFHQPFQIPQPGLHSHYNLCAISSLDHPLSFLFPLSTHYFSALPLFLHFLLSSSSSLLSSPSSSPLFYLHLTKSTRPHPDKRRVFFSFSVYQAMARAFFTVLIFSFPSRRSSSSFSFSSCVCTFARIAFLE